MALNRDIYRELEDLLGPENISEDPLVLDGYAYFQLAGLDPNARFQQRAEAVALPGNAKEVQQIVKLCNRRNIKYKASSTGYGPFNAPGSEGIILLDMRRMNRILDIDTKNMMVLVEPYVSFIQVQAEAHKLGLNCHIIGAGCQVSYLASLTSMVGNNTQAISQGYSGRNLLGVEWVLPTGEIIRLGAPGSGAGWFSGDGPGPSLRGIMRGAAGATGGLGVFTKCAGHLHPWPGPERLDIHGVAPYYESEIPPNFEYHVIEWPTWEQCADGQYKIGESGIAFALHKTGGPGSHGSIVTGNNNEYYARRKAGEFYIPEVSWAIVTAGFTPEEHAYNKKVLNRILEDTGGKITPVGEEHDWKHRDFINMIKACFIPRLAFRLTGTFGTDGMMGHETVDNCMRALKADGRLRDRFIEKGDMMDDGTYNNWGVTYEGAHFALLEGGYQFSPIDAKSIKGFDDMTQEGTEIALTMPLGYGWMVTGARAEELGHRFGNVQNWMRRIKRSFDPNETSDPVGYISARAK